MRKLLASLAAIATAVAMFAMPAQAEPPHYTGPCDITLPSGTIHPGTNGIPSDGNFGSNTIVCGAGRGVTIITPTSGQSGALYTVSVGDNSELHDLTVNATYSTEKAIRNPGENTLLQWVEATQGSHNGISGFPAPSTTSSVETLSHISAHDNGNGNFKGTDAGGIKVAGARVTMDSISAKNNRGNGVWYDCGAYGPVTLNNTTVSGNDLKGVFVEISAFLTNTQTVGGLTGDNVTATGNNLDGVTTAGGFVFTSSRNAKFTHSTGSSNTNADQKIRQDGQHTAGDLQQGGCRNDPNNPLSGYLVPANDVSGVSTIKVAQNTCSDTFGVIADDYPAATCP
jgi:hypothetical protein